jgi:hypothetical protein
MHEQKILVRYIVEMLGAFFLLFWVVICSVKIRHAMPEGIGRTLVLFSPLVPFLLMIGAVARYFWRVDEYMRLRILENWAMTAAVTMGWTFTYNFLENIGFPRLGIWTVCPTMGVVSAVLFIVRRMAGR